MISKIVSRKKRICRTSAVKLTAIFKPRLIVKLVNRCSVDKGTSNNTTLPPYPQFESLLPAFDGRVVKGELVLPDDGSAIFVSCVRHYIEVRCPHLKFPLPVDDGGERCADQERTFGVAL